MNDYSGIAGHLQTIGVRVRRPVLAVIVTVLAFALILWLHSRLQIPATRFQDVLLLREPLDTGVRRGGRHRLG